MFSVFKNLNRFSGKSKILDAFGIFFARYFLYLVIEFLMLYASFASNWRVLVYPLISGLFAAFVINNVIYVFYKEKRPATLKSTNILIPVPKNPSFPSRHSALLFGLSFYLFFYSFPLATVFIIFSCIVGVSRVFCGVHWFRDILAGAVVGLISALLIYSLVNYIKL